MYKKSAVRFFALDSNYTAPQQLAWLAKELQNSGSDWKICYFHQPLCSYGATHGSSAEFAGHEHFCGRVKPQEGIYHFTEGASGKLRPGDLKKSALTAAGDDQDRSFMLVEIAGDELYFQTVLRAGGTVDSGMIRRVVTPSGVTSGTAEVIGMPSALSRDRR